MLLIVVQDIVRFEEKNFGTKKKKKRGETVAVRPLLEVRY